MSRIKKLICKLRGHRWGHFICGVRVDSIAKYKDWSVRYIKCDRCKRIINDKTKSLEPEIIELVNKNFHDLLL